MLLKDKIRSNFVVVKHKHILWDFDAVEFWLREYAKINCATECAHRDGHQPFTRVYLDGHAFTDPKLQRGFNALSDALNYEYIDTGLVPRPITHDGTLAGCYPHYKPFTCDDAAKISAKDSAQKKLDDLANNRVASYFFDWVEGKRIRKDGYCSPLMDAMMQHAHYAIWNVREFDKALDSLKCLDGNTQLEDRAISAVIADIRTRRGHVLNASSLYGFTPDGVKEVLKHKISRILLELYFSKAKSLAKASLKLHLELPDRERAEALTKKAHAVFANFKKSLDLGADALYPSVLREKFDHDFRHALDHPHVRAGFTAEQITALESIIRAHGRTPNQFRQGFVVTAVGGKPADPMGDLVGKRIGWLRVDKQVPRVRKNRRYSCTCLNCGYSVEVDADELRRGNKISCGFDGGCFTDQDKRPKPVTLRRKEPVLAYATKKLEYIRSRVKNDKAYKQQGIANLFHCPEQLVHALGLPLYHDAEVDRQRLDDEPSKPGPAHYMPGCTYWTHPTVNKARTRHCAEVFVYDKHGEQVLAPSSVAASKILSGCGVMLSAQAISSRMFVYRNNGKDPKLAITDHLDKLREAKSAAKTDMEL